MVEANQTYFLTAGATKGGEWMLGEGTEGDLCYKAQHPYVIFRHASTGAPQPGYDKNKLIAKGYVVQ